MASAKIIKVKESDKELKAAFKEGINPYNSEASNAYRVEKS